MNAHPDEAYFRRRLASLDRFGGRAFTGSVFRFVHPRHSKPADISSGLGAMQASGRWHLKGMGQLTYTALTTITAHAEVLAHVTYYNLPVEHALPRLLVALDTDLKRVLDLTDGKVRQRLKLGADTIRNLDWRRENRLKQEATTQAWGRLFLAAGYEAILVPSAANQGTNLIVFPANLLTGSTFTVDRMLEET